MNAFALRAQAVVNNRAVVRGDLNNIMIGAWAQVGEGSVLHAARCGPMPLWILLSALPPWSRSPAPLLFRSSPTGFPAATSIGRYVYIGKNCMIRSANIGPWSEIGDGCVVMEGAVLEGFNALLPGTGECCSS